MMANTYLPLQNRLKELEQQVSDLKDTVNRQRDTIRTLQRTNESLADQLAYNSPASRPKIGGLIESSDIEIQQRESLKRQKDLITKMTDEIENFKSKIFNLEQKQKEMKTYKSNEKYTQTNIEIIKNWQTKLEHCSLEYLVSLHPDNSNKQLFENCQKGCVDLLDEIYIDAKNVKKDVSTDDTESKTNEESKITQDIMSCFNELFTKHIKLTINYASL
eukprot:278502_1